MPSEKDTEVVSEGTSECNQSPLRKKTPKTRNKFPVSFKFQHQFWQLRGQSTLSHSGQQWMHREDDQKMINAQQYYPGTPSQVPDTTVPLRWHLSLRFRQDKFIKGWFFCVFFLPSSSLSLFFPVFKLRWSFNIQNKQQQFHSFTSVCLKK